MKRLLSTAVLVRKAPSQADRIMAAIKGQKAMLSQPTEAEVRDAIARATRDLEDMRVKRGSDWEPMYGSLGYRLVPTAEGALTLRAWVAIERPD